METLIAIGSINSFFFSLVVFNKHQRTKADNLLTVLFVILGLSFGIVYLSYILNLPVLQILIWNISLLIAPIFYLYAYLLIKENIQLKKSNLINFIPYAISLVYLVIIFIFYSETEIDNLFNNSIKDTGLLFVSFTIIEILIIPFYTFLIFRLLRKHNENIKLFFSNLTDHNLVWLRVLMIGILFIWFFINFLYYLPSLSNEINLKYGFGVSSIFIFYLGYFATKQKPIYNKEFINQYKNKKYYKSEIKKDEIDFFYAKLIDVLENKKPYLEPNISLFNLAKMVNISPHNLSQIINTKSKMNFFELMNTYRIDEFKRKIKNGENKKLTLISIAYDCGFNSKSTFNRVFKRVTGQTPSNYLKTINNK